MLRWIGVLLGLSTLFAASAGATYWFFKPGGFESVSRELAADAGRELLAYAASSKEPRPKVGQSSRSGVGPGKHEHERDPPAPVSSRAPPVADHGSPDTPTGRATCMEAIGQSAARACEVTVFDALYFGAPMELRRSSQEFSRLAQRQCPGSGHAITLLYQAASNSMLSRMSPGWTALDARQNPGEVLLTRCLGEVAQALSIPGMDMAVARYR